MVKVALPPMGITAGAMVFATEAIPPPPPVTVIGALAGGAFPPLVLSVPVVLVTVPAVDDVMATTIVQPTAGIVAPLAIVIVVAVTATPVHVPVLSPIVVTPAGIVSTNGAVSVSGAAFVLASVIVSIAVPPTLIVGGAIVFASVGPLSMRLSVSEALALVPDGNIRYGHDIRDRRRREIGGERHRHHVSEGVARPSVHACTRRSEIGGAGNHAAARIAAGVAGDCAVKRYATRQDVVDRDVDGIRGARIGHHDGVCSVAGGYVRRTAIGLRHIERDVGRQDIAVRRADRRLCAVARHGSVDERIRRHAGVNTPRAR